MKTYLSIFMILLSVSLMAQTKYQERIANFMADKAVKEFNLNQEQRDQLMQSRLDHFAGMEAISAQGIEGDEKAEASKAVNQAQMKVVRELTGLKGKEAAEWWRATNKEAKGK